MKAWHYAWFVFLGGCCYGVLSTFVKLAYTSGYSATEVTGGQYLFGTLLIWGLVLFTKRRTIAFNQAGKLLLSGIPFGLTGVFYYQSLQTLHASMAIIFLFQFVWIGTLFERVFHKKKPSIGKMLSIAILLIGSVLAASLVSDKGIVPAWEGTVWALLSALTFTTFIFLSSSVGRETPPLLKSALLSTGGLIVVFILFPPMFLFDLPVLTGVAPYGLLLGIFGVVLPPLLFSIGMPHIGPGLGTILAAAELPVAVTMSSLVLYEQVSLSQWIGVALILGGIVAGNITRSRSVV